MNPPITGSAGVNAPLRLALVGTGFGRMHAEGIRRLPKKIQLVGVCSATRANAERFANEFDAPFATDRFEDLLARPDVDAVDLCSPHWLHMEMAVAAARAGKHILVEKPIARTIAESEAMIAAARQAGVTFMVSQNQRYFGQCVKAKQLLNAGVIGQPFLMVSYIHGLGMIKGFRRSLEQSGGGTLIDFGLHRLDLMRWLMGPVSSLYGQTSNFAQPQLEGEDTAVVVLRFASGALGSFVITRSARLTVPVEGLRIFGTSGSLEIDDLPRTLTLHTEGASGPVVSQVFRFDVTHADTICQVLEAFADSVVQQSPPPISGPDGLATLELTLSSYAAMKTGQAIVLTHQEVGS